jgi:hypothetical protein
VCRFSTAHSGDPRRGVRATTPGPTTSRGTPQWHDLKAFREERLDGPTALEIIDDIAVREAAELNDTSSEQVSHRMRIRSTDDVFEAEVRYPRNLLVPAERTEIFCLAEASLSGEWIETMASFVDDVEG